MKPAPLSVQLCAMKWAPVFAAADADALQWAIVELDACDTDMVTAVADSFAYLVSNGFAVGRPKGKAS